MLWPPTSLPAAFACMPCRPAPVRTRAASGADRFDELLDRVRERTPANQLVTIDQIGRVRGLCFASEAGAPLAGLRHLYRDRGSPHRCVIGGHS